MKRWLAAAVGGLAIVAIPSAVGVDSFAVNLVSQTSSTITLGWSPQPGYGYLFSAGGVLVSRTNDPNRSQVRFSKVPSGIYDIDVITKGANGHYPPAVPPPPKAQCEDGVDNDGDGKIDYPADPGCSSDTDNDETDTTQPPPGGNVYISPAGNDGNACTSTSPCRTVTRAYQVASNGDVVSMADGYYGCATLTGTKSLVFRGDGNGGTGGNVPWITCVSGRPTSDSSWPVSLKVTSGTANLTLDGVWVAGLGLDRGSSNITLTNTHITCENDAAHFALLDGFCTAMIVEGANNFTMTGGEIGPTYEGQGFGSGSWHYGSNATYDGVRFHDNLPNSGHSELLLVWSGNGLTIKNSTFTGWGGTAAIYFSEFGTVGASNVLFENNFIGKTPSAQIYALYIGTLTNAGGTRNFKIRYNTIYNGIYSDNAGQDGSQILGNVSGYSSECPTGFLIDHNVWGDDDNRSCGSNSFTVPSASYTCSGCGFDTSGHLTASSPAIGRGNPSDFPAKDIDGQTRPIGTVDAGSDER